MLLGGLISGRIGDRWGRKPALLFSMGLNGISAVFSALSPQFPGREVYWLLAFRILAGVGVGGSVPCAFSLMAEWSANESRGFAMSLLSAAWTAGSIFTSLAAWIILSPVDNTKTWPWFLLVASIPAFIAFFMTKVYVEEAPSSFRKIRTQVSQEDDANLIEPPLNFRTSATITYFFVSLTTIGIAIIWFTLSFGSYGVSTWIGDVFQNLGYKDPFGVSLLFNISSIPGNLISFYFVDRFGRKLLIFLGMTLSAVAALLFTLLTEPWLVIACVCLYSTTTTLGWVGLGVISAESFPYEIRTTSLGITAAFGRIGSITANLVNPYLLKQHAIVGVAGANLLLGGIFSLLFLRDRTGHDLD